MLGSQCLHAFHTCVPLGTSETPRFQPRQTRRQASVGLVPIVPSSSGARDALRSLATPQTTCDERCRSLSWARSTASVVRRATDGSRALAPPVHQGWRMVRAPHAPIRTPPVSGGPRDTELGIGKHACAGGRPLHWMVGLLEGTSPIQSGHLFSGTDPVTCSASSNILPILVGHRSPGSRALRTRAARRVASPLDGGLLAALRGWAAVPVARGARQGSAQFGDKAV